MDLETFDARHWVKRAIGRDDVPFDLIAVKPWRRNELIASTYRAGNVFLAGDAAHTMSPTGGLGMNTGIVDAVNLGWKVEAALAGWAGGELLNSYSIEQIPLARRNAHASTHNYHIWTGLKTKCGPIESQTAEGDRVRREIGQSLKAGLKIEWECLGVQLGYHYVDSPITIPDNTPEPPDPISEVIQTARPGSRAPHCWVSPGRSTLDYFGRSHVLLRLGPEPGDVSRFESAARRRCVPLTIVDFAAPEIYAQYGAKYVLVRPDGHIAWRADRLPEDPLGIIDRVRGASVLPGASATVAAPALGTSEP